MTCTACGGHLIPSQFKGEIDVCMMCGRDGPQPTPAPTPKPRGGSRLIRLTPEGLARLKAIRSEFAGIDVATPSPKGRPRKVRSI